MKYAVIRLNGRQHKVSEGDEFLVDGFDVKKPEYEVLLLVEDKDVKVGTPVLKDVKVELKVLGDEKGEKVQVNKYKAKSRYRKRIGFRSQNTRLRVGKIS